MPVLGHGRVLRAQARVTHAVALVSRSIHGAAARTAKAFLLFAVAIAPYIDVLRLLLRAVIITVNSLGSVSQNRIHRRSQNRLEAPALGLAVISGTAPLNGTSVPSSSW